MKLAAIAGVAGLLLAACGGSSGGGGKTLIISSDLPLQGSNKDPNDMTNNAMKLYLEQIGNKITTADGTEYSLEFKAYDNATAAKGAWDDAQCAKCAQSSKACEGGSDDREDPGGGERRDTKVAEGDEQYGDPPRGSLAESHDEGTHAARAIGLDLVEVLAEEHGGDDAGPR